MAETSVAGMVDRFAVYGEQKAGRIAQIQNLTVFFQAGAVQGWRHFYIAKVKLIAAADIHAVEIGDAFSL